MTSSERHRTPPGPARLYRMSAQRTLATIPAGSISALLTDPPYTSVNRQGGSGSHLQRWFPGGLSWVEIGRILAVARRKLRQLEIAARLDDLKIPPGNRLEALKGRRAGQYSIRINDQWRVCFRWTQAGALDVEIIDYH